MAWIVRLLLILNFNFQTGSCYVAQVGLELVMLPSVSPVPQAVLMCQFYKHSLV